MNEIIWVMTQEMVLYLTRFSSPRRAQTSDYIRYSRVVVRQVGNGHTEYLYTGHAEYPDIMERYEKIYQGYNSAAPSFVSSAFTNDRENDSGSPFTDNSFLRGLLKSQTVFNESDEVIKKTDYEYEIVEDNSSVTAFKNQYLKSFFKFYFPCATIYNPPPVGPLSMIYGDAPGAHLQDYYYHRNTWKYLKRVTEKTYEVGTNNFVNSESEFYYASPSKLTWKKSFGSDERDMVSTFSYSGDYTIPSGTLSPEVSAIEDAIVRNQFLLPVETIHYVDDGIELKVLNASFITYQTEHGMVLPYEVFTLEKSLLLDDFVQTDMTTSSSPQLILKDSRYHKVKTLESYDLCANPIVEKINNGTSSSFVYGDNSTQPVAVFANGHVNFDPYSDLPIYGPGIGSECSYTGFEDPFIDGWDTYGATLTNDSYSGEKSSHSGSCNCC